MIDGNVGGIDRIIRIAAGALFSVAALMGIIPAWGWAGVLLIGTGVFEMCPVYSMIGRSTYVRPRRKQIKRKPKL
jgi:Protein of unknown function (DUF2892)